MSDETLVLREPDVNDGARLHGFVRALHPLAENSVYCNILQCTHFSETTVVAEREGHIIGFVSGYLHPKKASTYFLWQVGVHAEGRGVGLPLRMIQAVLARPACAHVTTLEATVTASNSASQGLFRRLAQAEGAQCHVTPDYLEAAHFGPDNVYPEELFTVTPLSTPGRGQASDGA
jgi:L-2,4-diaminobutyric acid acetyltransferase